MIIQNLRFINEFENTIMDYYFADYFPRIFT